MKRFLLLSVLFLSSCTPALQNSIANSLNTSNRQSAVNKNPPVIGAKCISRDGQIRLNQLRQGLNACFFSALAPVELGEIARVDTQIILRFQTKPDLKYQESYEPRDEAFNGQRIGYILPITLPDSITGAVVVSFSGVGKVLIGQLLQSRIEFLRGFVSVQLPPLDAKTAQYFDAQGNMTDASRRFANLGERPYQAVVQLRACSVDGLCVVSPFTDLATR